MLWKGGSLVMGGAGPTGASMSGRPVFTTTPCEVKCSVSYAISCTISWVKGAHSPPYRSLCATGQPED